MDDLKEGLRGYFPARWFERNAQNVDRLLSVMAAGLDVARQVAEEVSRETAVNTAVESLGDMERELALPSGQLLPVEERRRRIIARRWGREGPINRARFEQALSFLLGVPVHMVPNYGDFSVTFEFPCGPPVDLNLLTEYIRRNKRAHIAHDFTATAPTAEVAVSADTDHFEVDYPICGTFYPEDAEGRTTMGTVAASADGYTGLIGYQSCGDFFAGEEG